jgi:dipeptidyl aminopeptidase/acylaminoacyl peptidase
MFMRFAAAFLGVTILWTPGPALADTALDLKKVTGPSAWLGTAVMNAWWAADGRHLYWQQMDPAGGGVLTWEMSTNDGKSTLLTEPLPPALDGPATAQDPAGVRFARVGGDGDVWLIDLDLGEPVRVTSTPDAESDVRFSATGDRLIYRRGQDWFGWTLEGGEEKPVLHLAAGRDATMPLDPEDQTTVRLDPQVEIVSSDVSPSGSAALVTTTPLGHDAGELAGMPVFLTESGYPEMKIDPLSVRIGRNPIAPHRLWLVDVTGGRAQTVDLSSVPGILDDPLAQDRAAQNLPPLSGPRGVTIGLVRWNPDGSSAVVGLDAIDRRDTWLVEVDAVTGALRTLWRESAPVAISMPFGFLPDGRLWFQSEKAGWFGLYLTDGTTVSTVVEGPFEATEIHWTADGSRAFFRCNRSEPVDYEVCTVRADGSELRELTALDGIGAPIAFDIVLPSPDATQIAVKFSAGYMPVQLALIDAATGAEIGRTDTRSAELKAMNPPEPEIVQIPLSTTAQPMWAKLWDPADAAEGRRHPIVLILHGGNTYQAVGRFQHSSPSSAFFAQILADKGYLVLEMDYRGSLGYGREWRDAVAGRIGFSEVEDMRDAIAWLAAERNGDASRAGVQGCSYGGYLAYMAAFLAPDLIRASAAWNGFSDWTISFGSNSGALLGDPTLNPEAFRASSATSHVEDFSGDLLIVHSIDDEVIPYEAAVRVVQRLLDLGKENWDFATYPTGWHCFIQRPDLRPDAYRRTIDLFDRTIGEE